MQSTPNFLHEQRVAIEAGIAAARFTEHVRAAKGNVPDSKPDESPVTIGDLGAQAIICNILQQAFPSDSIVGEESELSLAGSLLLYKELLATEFPNFEDFRRALARGAGKPTSRFWTVDPIDGTKGFVRGEQYAVAIALLVDYEVVVAVLVCPLYGRMFSRFSPTNTVFSAVKGSGAWRAAISELDQLSSIAVRAVAPIELVQLAGNDRPDLHYQALLSVCGRVDAVHNIDGQVKYAAVAAGDATAFVRFPRSLSNPSTRYIWDHAPGSLLVQEAGGVVSDIEGKPLDFSVGNSLDRNLGLIAAPESIQADLVEWCRKYLFTDIGPATPKI